MKLTWMSLLLLAPLLTTLTSKAASTTENRSWDEIRADNSVTLEMPDLGGLNVFELCATKTHFISTAPVSKCVEKAVTAREACLIKFGSKQCRPLKSNEEPEANEVLQDYTSCVKTETVQKAQFDRKHRVTKCVRSEDNDSSRCLEYQTEEKTYPTAYDIPIYSEDHEFLDLKLYVIPNCSI